MLPLRFGSVERRTNDDVRSRTTSLFAALEIATGTVTQEARARHTGANFLAFLRRVDRVYPDQELDVILENVSTHKSRRSTPGSNGIRGSPSTSPRPRRRR